MSECERECPTCGQVALVRDGQYMPLGQDDHDAIHIEETIASNINDLAAGFDPARMQWAHLGARQMSGDLDLVERLNAAAKACRAQCDDLIARACEQAAARIEADARRWDALDTALRERDKQLIASLQREKEKDAALRELVAARAAHTDNLRDEKCPTAMFIESRDRMLGAWDAAEAALAAPRSAPDTPAEEP